MGVLMKCGHAAQGTMKVDGQDKPCCVICYPKPEANIPQDSSKALASLVGRMARCSYYNGRWKPGPSIGGCCCDDCRKREPQQGRACKCEQPSSPDLAFFTHHPEKPYDEFYCGCHGWD